MKKLRDGSIIALSMMVLLGTIGCGSEQAATVKRDEPAYQEPPKAERARVTVVQEEPASRSDSVTSDLKRIEQKTAERSSNDQCKTDADCVVIPTNLDGCLPCLGDNSIQEPENKDSAKKIMSEFKEKCLPVLEELKSGKGNPVRSKHRTCQFNGAKCEDGMCVLANIETEGQGQGGQDAQPSQPASSRRGGENGRYGEANGQASYGGRDRYNNSLNQPNFGLDRNGSQNPQGYDRQFNYPGRSAGITQDDYGHQSRWPQAGANSRYGNTDGPTLPQGYNQQRSYPGQPGAGQQAGLGQQGRWPQGNGAANFSQANGHQGNGLGRSDFGLNQGNTRGGFGAQGNGRGQNFGNPQGNNLGRSDFGFNQGNGRGGALGPQANGRGQNFGAQNNGLGRSDFGLNQGNGRGAGWPQGNSLGSGFNQGAGGRGNVGLPQNGRGGAGGSWPQGNSLGSGFNQGAGRGNMGLPQNGRGAGGSWSQGNGLGGGFGQGAGQGQFPQGYGNRQQYPGR